MQSRYSDGYFLRVYIEFGGKFILQIELFFVCFFKLSLNGQMESKLNFDSQVF